MFLRILKTIGSFLLNFIEAIITALAIFVIIYLFLFQPHQVKGNSMRTSLLESFHDKEYLLTNKLVYNFDQPQRGDIVIFRAPHNQDYDYIKRIIGLPGETIKIEDGQVYINDQVLDESDYLPEEVKTNPGKFLKEGEEMTIPLRKYFVVGDNRPNSYDSRTWGFISIKDIVGKAWLRYWPVKKMGLIDYKKITY